jgi:hypothetical protein
MELKIAELRLAIKWVEARYDGHFPPGIFATWQGMRKELADLIAKKAT